VPDATNILHELADRMVAISLQMRRLSSQTDPATRYVLIAAAARLDEAEKIISSGRAPARNKAKVLELDRRSPPPRAIRCPRRGEITDEMVELVRRELQP
jgi:hypothetical protein